ncbi:MAG TPA: PadR family transcriptional regulator [Gaiellaceae bacterium]|nr:PadR family transcriptional regulator [Gaiellaceae bacterium]
MRERTRRRLRARNRRFHEGRWRVRARVERLAEPALLLLLAERPTHGYELLDRLPDLLGAERVDVGNLYRVLRGLEEEGVVTSEWRADLPGPAKRTYALTAEGRALLDAWLEALGALRAGLDDFLTRAAEGGDHVRTETPPRVAGAEP